MGDEIRVSKKTLNCFHCPCWISLVTMEPEIRRSQILENISYICCESISANSIMWFEMYKYPRYIDHELIVDFPFFSAVDRSGEVERFCDWGIVTPWKLNYIIVIWITPNEFLFVLQSTCINMITVITKVSFIFKELIGERTWFLLAVWRH